MSTKSRWIIKVHVWDEEGTQFGELRYGSSLEASVFIRTLSDDEIQDFFRIGEHTFLSKLNALGVYQLN
jgi:hypothetical protein